MSMSSNLQKQVEAFAMENDVPSLTRLLVEWKECDSEWLLFVESRLCAPSTTPEQKSQLQPKNKLYKPIPSSVLRMQ